MKNEKTFTQIGEEVGNLVSDKQKSYGDSFGRSGECLRQMFPNGIQPEQYDDLLTVARILDKLFRIATDPKAFGECPWTDIAGYSLLGMKRFMKEKEDTKIMRQKDYGYPQYGKAELGDVIGDSDIDYTPPLI